MSTVYRLERQSGMRVANAIDEDQWRRTHVIASRELEHPPGARLHLVVRELRLAEVFECHDEAALRWLRDQECRPGVLQW